MIPDSSNLTLNQPVQTSPNVPPTTVTGQAPITPQTAVPVMQEVPKPKSKILPLLVILLVLIGLGCGGYWAYKNYFVSPAPQSTPEEVIPTPIATEDPTANWETVTDGANGYEFKIPIGWQSYPGRKGTDRFVSRLEGWSVLINEQTKIIQTSINIEKCYPPNCDVEIGKNPISGTKPNFKDSIKFANYKATKETYISDDSPWESKKSYRLVVEKNNGIYIIDWQDFSPIFDQILSTFKFVDQATDKTISENKKIGYIKSITPNHDNYLLEVDYIDFLQDNTAPNGYRIENPSKETVKLPTDLPGSEPKVTMQTYSHASDGNFNFNQTITFSEFTSSFGTNSSIKNAPYWIETKNGIVTKITEQYIP